MRATAATATALIFLAPSKTWEHEQNQKYNPLRRDLATCVGRFHSLLLFSQPNCDFSYKNVQFWIISYGLIYAPHISYHFAELTVVSEPFLKMVPQERVRVRI